MTDERAPNPVAVRRIVAHLRGEDLVNFRAAVESFANGWTVVSKDVYSEAVKMLSEWDAAWEEGIVEAPGAPAIWEPETGLAARTNAFTAGAALLEED